MSNFRDLFSDEPTEETVPVVDEVSEPTDTLQEEPNVTEELTTEEPTTEEQPPSPAPVVEPIRREPIEAPKDINTLDFLAEEWKDHGFTRETIEDQFKDFLPAFEKLTAQLNEAQAEKHKLEASPIFAEAKVVQELQDMWVENSKDWEEELADAIPDEYKAMNKLGKKKKGELEAFIATEVSTYMSSRLRQGKKVTNPLTVLSTKIARHIKTLEAQGKDVAAKETQASNESVASLEQQKRTASIQSGTPQVPAAGNSTTRPKSQLHQRLLNVFSN